MRVVNVTKSQADVFVTQKHYSRKAPIFWAGFGLVIDGMIEGVVVYGQPSPPIQRFSFRERDFRIYELSRLVLQTSQRNAGSYIVGRSLQMLPSPCAVVSYADTEYGHAGIIYQATNWLYTGATVSHDHSYMVDGQRLHPITLRDMGITNPKEWARANGIKTVPPMKKHRYFYLVGTRSERRYMLGKMNYPIVRDYPKADKTMYDDGVRVNMPHQEGFL